MTEIPSNDDQTVTLGGDDQSMQAVAPSVLVPKLSTASQVRVVGPSEVKERPMGLVETWLRLGMGLVWFALTSLVFTIALMFALPSRRTRIRIGNVYGTWAGKGASWLTGSQFVIRGEEHATKPCIYVANHASILDIFLGIWVSPLNTCGVAKKEVVYYPFFGQFYWLAGHLCIDRGNNTKAVDSLKRLASFVRENGLSVFIWPEGTRSRDGRLQPFKRGAFHLALATGLPVVPVVISNSHVAWPNRSLRMNKTSVGITFLPPIDTSTWTKETLDTHMDELRQVLAVALPASQRPIEQTAPRSLAA
jgi:lysophosphatidate acyltransferase